MSDGIPDPGDIMITGVGESCALWRDLLDEDSHVRLAPRIAQVAKMDLIAQAVARVVDRTRG